jgi:hypothetical protein
MSANLEKRLQAVEEAVRRLQSQLEGTEDPRTMWWREQVGRFKDDPEFEEILRFGKQYRESLRPKRKKRRS